ncbi:MAG: TMEM165/GDT1 family protein [Cyanobacteria bacterium CRU_2_1]|nr:TMEM165/GDT1 family protein [Cyanobacteria bacterium RU_5_0]NJR60340.1 TMEM165/GDT1 family protein [Cyanobacteria bacterium CRU_2_1]
MDWNLLGLSFVTVFISELGDKSQLATIALSGSGKSLRAVFLGTAAALLLASFLGVILGEGASQVLPTRWVKAIAAIGFAAMAVKLLWFGSEEEQNESFQNKLS